MPCRPWSLTDRATSSSGTPGWSPASLMTIGRVTPVTTSTSPCWRNIEAMLVGGPPNMSVVRSTAPPLLLLSLPHVAVNGRGLVAFAPEVARDPVGRHHRAVAAARAADADGDVGLALAPVERGQVLDQLREAPQRLAHLVARVQEAHHPRV